MNIQIFGIKKCQDTRKAERFFKERGIKYQFIDLTIKGMSKGELKSVNQQVAWGDLLNSSGKLYQSQYKTHMVRDIGEALLQNPLLLNTPVVRNGTAATVGYRPEIWKTWA